MANSNKRKGDRAEREAFAVLCLLAPDLLVPRPQRLLGAGRREDTGDLWVLPDVTVQVKHRADPAQAIRIAADGGRGAGTARGVRGSRWVWCRFRAPGGRRRAVGRLLRELAGARLETLAVFRSVTGALPTSGATIRRPAHGISGWRWSTAGGTAALYVGTLEAWLHAYRRANRAAGPFTGPGRPG